jgi:hypothetical protein
LEAEGEGVIGIVFNAVQLQVKRVSAGKVEVNEGIAPCPQMG